MINIHNKKFLINKSKYPIANKIRLESALSGINKKYYNIRVVEQDNYYLVVATFEIEKV